MLRGLGLACPINEWTTNTWVEVDSLDKPSVLIREPCWDCGCIESASYHPVMHSSGGEVDLS